jgi:hypothetical protein
MLRTLKSWYKKRKEIFVEIGGMAPSADSVVKARI